MRYNRKTENFDIPNMSRTEVTKDAYNHDCGDSLQNRVKLKTTHDSVIPLLATPLGVPGETLMCAYQETGVRISTTAFLVTAKLPTI